LRPFLRPFVFRIDRSADYTYEAPVYRGRHANTLESLSASLLRNFIIDDLVERIRTGCCDRKYRDVPVVYELCDARSHAAKSEM